MVGKETSRYATRRILVLGVLVVVLVMSSMLVYEFLPIFHEQSHEVPLPGIPVQNTTFAGLVSETPDAAIFAQGPVISTEDSVEMRITETINQPAISQEEAEQIGLDFFSRLPYMSNITLEPDHFWNQLRDKPYYSLRYFVGQFEFYATVHPMTGRVIGISPHWSVLAQYNTSMDLGVLSTEKVEERAYDFLARNNYTLPRNARLIGPELETDTIRTNFPAYYLRFCCAVNGCLVQGNTLTMLLSIRAGVVMNFLYHWRNVTSIPIENVLPAIEAEQAALHYLGTKLNATDFSIVTSSLQFYILSSWPITKFQLCWVIEITHERYGRIVMNALNLEVLLVYEYVTW